MATYKNAINWLVKNMHKMPTMDVPITMISDLFDRSQDVVVRDIARAYEANHGKKDAGQGSDNQNQKPP